MHIIKHSAIVPYSAQQIYALVDAVEDYPKFLPWCKSTHIKERHENLVIATVEIAKGGVHKAFTTRNSLTPHSKIEIELVEGPFKHLIGDWEFVALNETACKINFSLDFSFKHKLTALMIQPIMSHIADTMIDAFTKRALEVYGES